MYPSLLLAGGFVLGAATTPDPFNWWELMEKAPQVGVLLWFMFIVFPRLKGMESAVDRLSRTVLSIFVALPQLMEGTRAGMQGIIHEIDEAEARRNKKAE